MRIIGGNLNRFTTLMKIVATGYDRDELTPYNRKFYENLKAAHELSERFDSEFEITTKQYNHLNQLAYDLEKSS